MEAVQNFKEAMSNPNSRKAFIERNKLNIMMYGAGATTILFVYHVLSDGDFSFLLTLGGLTRLMGFFFLLTKMVTERSCSGVSLKTLELYALIFLARLSSILFYEGYLPYDSSGDWFYQFVEIVSLILVGVLIFLSVVTYKSTYNAAEDGFGRFKSIPTQSKFFEQRNQETQRCNYGGASLGRGNVADYLCCTNLCFCSFLLFSGSICADHPVLLDGTIVTPFLEP